MPNVFFTWMQVYENHLSTFKIEPFTCLSEKGTKYVHYQLSISSWNKCLKCIETICNEYLCAIWNIEILDFNFNPLIASWEFTSLNLCQKPWFFCYKIFPVTLCFVDFFVTNIYWNKYIAVICVRNNLSEMHVNVQYNLFAIVVSGLYSIFKKV